MAGHAVALALLATPLLSHARGPDPQNGLAVGRLHTVRALFSPTRGLELGMPRDGWYAKGIESDKEAQWSKSYKAYSRALAEFQGRLKRQPDRSSLLAGWIAKARFQMLQSSRLLGHRHPMRRRTAADRIYDRASVLHNKWLAIRAFSGVAPDRLRGQVIRDYEIALRLSPGHQGARLGLAAFLHETGQRKRAAQQFDKVLRPVPKWLRLELATYYTAAGNSQQALSLLRRALTDDELPAMQRNYILGSNDFDRLRNHPGFSRMVAPTD